MISDANILALMEHDGSGPVLHGGRGPIWREVIWREALLAATVRLLLWDIPMRRPPVLSLFSLLRPAMLWPAVALAVLWIAGGAALRSRPFLFSLALRVFSFAAGSAAVGIALQLVMSIARSGWPFQVSMAITSLFSLALYGCWRWVSLLLAIVEDSASWERGWRRFAHAGLDLALIAATNSTAKWFFLAITALPAAWTWQQGMRGATAFGLALPVAVSAYFAVKLRESIGGMA